MTHSIAVAACRAARHGVPSTSSGTALRQDTVGEPVEPTLTESSVEARMLSLSKHRVSLQQRCRHKIFHNFSQNL
ncbi:MAG: hypothetical protein LBS86_07745 [Treponema sp.]|jgi:hypothetical protein|nr:hypothetical protein [Treponema sp.]